MKSILNKNAKRFIEKVTKYIYYASFYNEYNNKKRTVDLFYNKVSAPEDIYAPDLLEFQKVAFKFFYELTKIHEYYTLMYFDAEEKMLETIARIFVKIHFSEDNDIDEDIIPAQEEVQNICIFEHKKVFYLNREEKLIYLLDTRCLP